jgi:predicted DNA-binding protein (MmcQ/YjbR family)
VIDFVRRCCRSLPHVTETVQWGENLVFKIGGKIFVILALEPGGVWLSFKTSPADFAELVERPDIIPAPYFARASWVALESEEAMPAAELKARIRTAYELVSAALPRKTKAELFGGKAEPARKSRAGGRRPPVKS